MPIKYREEHRWTCMECGWVGTEDMKLRAPSPFSDEVTVTGCPQCREIERFEPLCDALGCGEPMSAATPTGEGGGSLWTCWTHDPDNPKNQKEDEGGKG